MAAQPKQMYDDEAKMADLGVGTRLISLSVKDDRTMNKPIVTPIYQASIYHAASCETFEGQIEDGYVYNRIRNPNTEEVEMILAQIEHGKGSLIFPSGMAAIFTTLLAFLRPGDHVVLQAPLYSCTSYVLENIFSKFQVEWTYIDGVKDVDEYKKAARKNTTMFFGETMCNPIMHFLDVKKLAEIGKELNILTVVDGTFTPPINHTPLDHGIDIVIQSCTKYIGGHSDMLAGSVTFNNLEHYEKQRMFRTFSGSNQSAFDSVLLVRSLRTLKVRVERHNENGLAVAKYLEAHPLVTRVHYIGLESHQHHSLAAGILKGFGGMMSIELGSRKKAIKFAESTKIFKLAVSLGGAESLIEHVVTMTHNDSVASEQGKVGVPDTLVRMSVGIEDIKDQLADLEQALQASETA